MSPRMLRLVLATAAGLLIAAAIAWMQTHQVATMSGGPPVAIGGPFSLVDHTGRSVTDADYRGRYLLVYFGYTWCPDVCPTELQTMASAIDRLGAAGDKVQPLFISVDPERDTVAHLAEYVALFHPRLVGLTGTPEQIARVARAYRVYYARVAPRDKDGPYLMDHSSFIYLMGPDGGFLTAFPAGTEAARLADQIKDRLQ